MCPRLQPEGEELCGRGTAQGRGVERCVSSAHSHRWVARGACDEATGSAARTSASRGEAPGLWPARAGISRGWKDDPPFAQRLLERGAPVCKGAGEGEDEMPDRDQAGRVGGMWTRDPTEGPPHTRNIEGLPMPRASTVAPRSSQRAPARSGLRAAGPRDAAGHAVHGGARVRDAVREGQGRRAWRQRSWRRSAPDSPAPGPDRASLCLATGPPLASSRRNRPWPERSYGLTA